MRKLLWIDEDAAYTELMGKRLATRQFDLFRLTRVPDPAAALEYDAVVLDFTFPGRCDWAFLEALRADSKGSTLPILTLLSRPLELHERLRLNNLRITHSVKWVPSGVLLQKIQEIFG